MLHDTFVMIADKNPFVGSRAIGDIEAYNAGIKYLHDNRISNLYQRLLSNLLLEEKPVTDIRAYFVEKLKLIDQNQNNSVGIFSKNDMGILFDIIDTSQKGVITYNQALSGFEQLGLSPDIHLKDSLMLLGHRNNDISKSQFINAAHALKALDCCVGPNVPSLKDLTQTALVSDSLNGGKIAEKSNISPERALSSKKK